MTDYGRGGVLGAATVLPATSAAGLLIANNANPIIVGGMLVVCFASLLVSISYVSRFLINRRASK